MSDFQLEVEFRKGRKINQHEERSQEIDKIESNDDDDDSKRESEESVETDEAGESTKDQCPLLSSRLIRG